MVSKVDGLRVLRFAEILCLALIALSFYLLYLSRSGEVHTVWEVLNPSFVPTLFITTFLLVALLLTSEKPAYKLLLIVAYSVLVHSFFSVVFPAGDASGQQIFLGRTRLVYDNAVVHGWFPWPEDTLQLRVFQSFRGENFQAGLSTVFARMFSVDVFWVHLFLVPVLWGVFTPVATYLVAFALARNDRVAALSALLFCAFPYSIYFGAISVPNSLGFIFFFYCLYFTLKDLDSKDSKNTFIMLAFSFFSFLSTYLTGIMSFSLVLFALAFKSYRSEKSSTFSSKISLVVSFVFVASILPLSVAYLRFLRPDTHAVFSLDKFRRLPSEEIVGLFLVGELINGFDLKTALLFVAGSTLAVFYMMYLLFNMKKKPNDTFRAQVFFLFGSFLLMLVDYRILKLFMVGVPFNEERLWVLRDFLAVPFASLVIFLVISRIATFLKARSASPVSLMDVRTLTKGSGIRAVGLFAAVNVLVALILSVWVISSVGVAYPHVASLQVTWYELEAAKFIDENSQERYVVIGDIWMTYAGEMIVGANNPGAYYFGEFNRTGYDLFVSMRENPSPELMLLAMNYTDTNVAYFVVTESRLGTEAFNGTVYRALQNGLNVFGPSGGFGDGKLYVFYYEK